MKTQNQYDAMLSVLEMRFSRLGIAVVNSQKESFKRSIRNGQTLSKAFHSAMKSTIGTIGKSYGTR